MTFALVSLVRGNVFDLWTDEVGRTRSKGLRQFKQRHHGRIATSSFEAAEIVLGKTGPLSHLLLGQLPLSPDPRKICPD